MKIALLQMILAKGVGEVAVRRFCDLVSQTKWRVPVDGFTDPRVLVERCSFSGVVAQRIVDQRPAAQKLSDRLQKQNVEMTWVGHRDFPKHVARLLGKKLPPVLFLRGNRALLESPGVGFCGSRRASERGLAIAEQCASQVASEGFAIVSGYASGVDERAHCAAMRSSGSTIIVLAQGILRQEEKTEVRSLENAENHLYVSQFPPDCAWFAHNAMKRNELILGLSKAMIVIEAGDKGGSLAAGESSLSYKEPLFVVEYKKAPPSAVGNEVLLSKGALPIRSNYRGVPVLEPLFREMRALKEASSGVNQMHLDL